MSTREPSERWNHISERWKHMKANYSTPLNQLETHMMNLDQASIAIAKILAELEQTTQCNVEAIRLVEIDVTSFQDINRMHKMRVAIELVRQPGHDWGV